MKGIFISLLACVISILLVVGGGEIDPGPTDPTKLVDTFVSDHVPEFSILLNPPALLFSLWLRRVMLLNL